MTKKQRRLLKKIIISLILFLIVTITNLILEKGFNDIFPYGLASIFDNNYGWLLPFGLYFLIYVYIGFNVLKKSFINIIHGQVFDENFLMAIATLGAFGLGIYTGINYHRPEGFDEACAVLLFYQVGEWFQSYAAGKSRKNISELMDIRPDYANLIKDDGSIDVIDPNEVSVGSIILVKPGEKIPLDGVIIKGNSTLDTSKLTGESLPREVIEGSEVLSGTINLTKSIEIKTSKEFSNSTVTKILELVENASNQKSKSETFINKFAKYYTPTVVILALIVAFILPLINGINGNWNTFSTWIYRALSFLVVSCPCALVISVPLSFFAGLGGASRNGILIKGSIHLERFNKVNIFVFDKTGTLTKGNFSISEIYPLDKKDEILELAAIAEKDSNHPIAISIKEAYNKEINSNYSLEDISGMGIKASLDNDVILCGNDKLMDKFSINYQKPDTVSTIVYVARNNEFIGYITIVDEIKEDAIETIDYLNSIGSKTIMLTGDNDKIAKNVCDKLHISEYRSNLLPQDKVSEIDKILDNKKNDEFVSFIGDGINDAPVIMKSDIGIAMGAVGSDAAIEASDIVLMHDDLKSLKTAKKIARKTMKLVYENIVFALGIKILILILAALGYANMWISVFGDVGVAIIAILNAMRANSKKY